MKSLKNRPSQEALALLRAATAQDASPETGVPRPETAASCPVCSRSRIRRDELRLSRTAELYTDSHDGAALERCELCGTMYVHCWTEVFDETWGIYGPVSPKEGEALVDAFRVGHTAAEWIVWSRIRRRPGLQGLPGDPWLSWVRTPIIPSGPSY